MPSLNLVGRILFLCTIESCANGVLLCRELCLDPAGKQQLLSVRWLVIS